MEVLNELENKYYIIKYDWPIYRYGFVLYSNLNQIEFEFICSGPNDYLFKKLLEICETFDKFSIIVRNKIVPDPKYSDRNLSGDAPRLEIEDWEIMSEPERSKYLAVTKFIYKWKQV